MASLLIVGPDIGRDQMPELGAHLDELAGDAAGVISFNRSLLPGIRQHLGGLHSEKSVEYFYDLVSATEFTEATSFVWRLARTWFQDPRLARYAAKYAVAGCHWGWLDELLIASLVAREVRHIASASSLLARFPAERFALVASNPGFTGAFESLAGGRVWRSALLPAASARHDALTPFFDRRRWPEKTARLLKQMAGRLAPGRTLHETIAGPTNRGKLWVQWHRNTEPLFRSPLVLQSYEIDGWRVPPELALPGIRRADGNRLCRGLERAGALARGRLAARAFITEEEQEILGQVFSFGGVSFYGNIRDLFQSEAPARIGLLRAASREIGASLSGAYRAAVLCSYVSPEQKLAAHHAARRGIPTVAVQHGLMSVNKLSADDIYADHYAAWGPREVREFDAVNPANRNKVHVVGSMLHDRNATPRDVAGDDSARLELGIAASAKILCFFAPSGGVVWHAGHPYDYVERVVSEVVPALASLDGVHVIVKIHPVEDVAVEQYLPAELVRRVTILRRYDPFQLIRISDVTVSDTSTTALDAICLGKPVVALSLYRRPASYRMPYEDYGVVSPAHDMDELSRAVQQLLSVPGNEEQFDAERERFLADCLVFDGRGEQRFVRLLEEIGDIGRRAPQALGERC